MKRYVKASVEDKFWDLHDTSYEVGTALENIITNMGLEDKFFPEEGLPTASLSDYEEVLREYEGSNGSVVSTSDILRDVTNYLNEVEGVSRAWFEDEIDAIRFRTNAGDTYQLVLQGRL